MGRARLPALGPEVPRSGGAVSRTLGRAVLAAMGWRIEGEIPNLRQFVIIIAPHTSNWDFVVGVSAKLALGLDALWLGKDTLFRFPFGALLHAIGGMPVDRSTPHAVVPRVAERFSRQRRMVVALAPEGTRKHVAHWRTGFYHIAHAAAVPIVPVALDWPGRAVRILSPFTTTGDADRDIAQLRQLYDGVRGRR